MSDEYHIYTMNDCDWWMATSTEEARADYIKHMGGYDELVDEDCPRQLTDDELDSLQFYVTEDRDATGDHHSFRNEMALRPQQSQFFASTEY